MATGPALRGAGRATSPGPKNLGAPTQAYLYVYMCMFYRSRPAKKAVWAIGRSMLGSPCKREKRTRSSARARPQSATGRDPLARHPTISNSTTLQFVSNLLVASASTLAAIPSDPPTVSETVRSRAGLPSISSSPAVHELVVSAHI
jgi:hypothetical protein